ncbi:hypothetical protein JOH51_003078 [Rhizobium leguminosarum]|nr:hypothetical protein [Rhizobium leguminosarum]
MEQNATAEFRAVTIALEIAGMDDAAEAGFAVLEKRNAMRLTRYSAPDRRRRFF